MEGRTDGVPAGGDLDQVHRHLALTGDLLRLASEAGRVGIWELDRTTGQARWSSVMRDLLGVDAAHPSTVDAWLALVHPDDRDRAHRGITGFDAATEASYRIVRPDGAICHLLVRGSPLQVDSSRAVGTIVDVTDWHRGSADMAGILEVITDGYYALDDHWRFTYVNRQAELLLETPRDRLLGRALWTAFPSTLGSRLEEVYRRVRATGEAEDFEFHYRPLERWLEVRTYPLPSGGLAVYFRDINERHGHELERERLLRAERQARAQAQRAQRSLAHQAAHDDLTGLANRRQMTHLLDDQDRDGTVLYLDLDRFKQVNDSLGHGVGDELLIELAGRLRICVRPGDVVARVGGDEFVVLLADTGTNLAEQIADRILARVRNPFHVRGHRLDVTASIGIAEFSTDTGVGEVLRMADVALYRAKDAGRDGHARYDLLAHVQATSRLRLEGELREAIADGDLLLHHQPAFDLGTGEVQGIEALVRWQHPERGLIPPGAFIPIAEDTGLIEPLFDWVLDQALTAATTWAAKGRSWSTWCNVSLRQFGRPGLASRVLERLEHHGLPATRLGLEMTESVVGHDASAILRELDELASAGVQLAIDDFGTGFSSLRRLRTLPFSLLKIDRGFVRDLDTDAGAATVSAIIDLAHASGNIVTAEGVEFPEQLAQLRAMGCDAACGYLLARPVPAAALPAAVDDALALLR